MVKFFFYKNLLNGPYTGFANGAVAFEGFYKDGREDGERRSYRDGKLISKAFFKNGLKTGTWEYFDKKGNLER